ncbi:MAG TPA: carbohydrate binding domain-containing protein [bacterium]|nr:carbohydrate binding domain-containing protein [bacterium]HPN46180.1 carbohydrate binding domain-containing protein [bacterium]
MKISRLNVLMFILFTLQVSIPEYVSADNMSIVITSPARFDHFDHCSAIHLAATATITEGDIKRVDFYQNDKALGGDTRAPFEKEWTNVATGIYVLTAKVTDTVGNTLLSNPVVIYVGNVQEGNMITNGEFNCSLSPWRLDNYEGAVSTISLVPDAGMTDDVSAAMVQISNIGNQTWGVQLMQPFKLKQGHTYEISFVAQADAPKDIQVTFSQDYDPWASYWFQDITIDELRLYGPYTYTCEVDDDKIMFKFVIGGNLTTFYLDAVQVIDKQWTAVAEPRPEVADSYQLFQNYPNPFNPVTHIQYALNHTDNVKLTICNLLGEEIISWQDVRPAGLHEYTWNGLNRNGQPVGSGVYLYTLQAGNFKMSRKMLFLK